MPTQLNLPGFVPVATSPAKIITKLQRRHGLKHRLFFAIFPAPVDAVQIHARAESLRQQHRFTEALIEPERLHITLQVLGDYADQIPVEHLEAAVQVAGGVRAQNFEIELDHALSFQRNGAFAFSAKKRESPFTNFRLELAQQLARRGFPPHPAGTPHMTLLCSHHHLVPEEAIRPIRFLIKEFALIHSYTGKHFYEELGRWNLCPSLTP